jgi:hypothetical protein
MPVDKTQAACPQCGVTFTFFTCRHWCRACGRTICADCSSGPDRCFALFRFGHEGSQCRQCVRARRSIDGKRVPITAPVVKPPPTGQQQQQQQQQQHLLAEIDRLKAKAALATALGEAWRLLNDCAQEVAPPDPDSLAALCAPAEFLADAVFREALNVELQAMIAARVADINYRRRRREEDEAIREWKKCFLQASSGSGSFDFRKRLALGSVPTMWEVVGPHRRVAPDPDSYSSEPDLRGGRDSTSLLDEIETTLLHKATEDGKEEMPFIYVRSPPRHGKTFCLDALFGADRQEHADVLKVEISHNVLNEEEKSTPFAAQRHFWTRVARRLLQQLGDAKVDPPGAALSEWESIARACPGIDGVPVVVCADELSHLLKSQTWEKGGVKQFFSSLARFQRVHMLRGTPMRRLVMTGFDHHPACGIAGSGFRCLTYAAASADVI